VRVAQDQFFHFILFYISYDFFVAGGGRDFEVRLGYVVGTGVQSHPGPQVRVAQGDAGLELLGPQGRNVDRRRAAGGGVAHEFPRDAGSPKPCSKACETLEILEKP
jgi:hypothetical protein